MALVNLKTILKKAKQDGFAVPAFNVYNLETVMGVISAAEESRSPVILQCYARLFKEGSAFYLAPSIIKAAVNADVPVCFHLDHGNGDTELMRALRYGCTGVMTDGSLLPFEENVALTKRTVCLAAPSGVSVEGELGHIGTTADASFTEFTDPGEAETFVRETGVDALAILVGTAHGRYKKAPKPDIDRISAINKITDAALVLHGGSGVPDEEIKKAIKAGISKVNFGTDVCYSFLDAVFATSRDTVAIDLFMKGAVKAVSDFALSKIRLLGSEKKA